MAIFAAPKAVIVPWSSSLTTTFDKVKGVIRQRFTCFVTAAVRFRFLCKNEVKQFFSIEVRDGKVLVDTQLPRCILFNKNGLWHLIHGNCT